MCFSQYYATVWQGKPWLLTNWCSDVAGLIWPVGVAFITNEHEKVHTVHFALHNFFTLNLTFHYIYFSAVYSNSASFGRIDILDAAIQVCSKANKFCKYFTFSGIHPKLTVYSQHHLVNITSQARIFVAHDTMFSYSVIDEGRISSVTIKWHEILDQQQINNQLIQSSLLGADIFTQYHVEIQAYRIVVSKLHLLLIKTAAEDSDSLWTRNTVCTGDSWQYCSFWGQCYILPINFQCLLHMFGSNLSFVISFRHREHNEKNVMYVRPGTSKYLNSVHYLCKYCTVALQKISTEPGYHLNLTISSMAHRGENNTVACNYAGVAAYDADIEITTVCLLQRNNGQGSKQSSIIHSSTSYRFQNIFSPNYSFVLVLFSYRRYASFSTSVTVRTSSCAPKPINVCHHNKTVPHSKYPLNTGFIFDEHFFSVQEGQCVIFQFYFLLNQQQRFIQGCASNIKQQNATGHIKFNITGFFRGKLCVVILNSQKEREKLNETNIVQRETNELSYQPSLWTQYRVHEDNTLKNFFLFDAFCSGQLDNLYLMGLPDEFCLSEMFRADLKIFHTCNPVRHMECEKGYEGEGKAWTVHHCVKPLSDLYQMSSYVIKGWDKIKSRKEIPLSDLYDMSPYVIKSGKEIPLSDLYQISPYLTRGWDEIKSGKKIPSSILLAKWLKNRTSLHAVATFAWFVRSKISSGSTPYFTVSFIANNHGSWIDIIAQATSSKMVKIGLQPEANHHSETVQSNLPKSSSFKKVPYHLEYVLWIHADDVKEEFNVQLFLHTYFDSNSTFLIHRMVWDGLVTFSQEYPTFCLSTPGTAFQGHINFCGKRSFSVSSVPSGQICSVLHQSWWGETAAGDFNCQQEAENWQFLPLGVRKFADAWRKQLCNLSESDLESVLGIFYSILLLWSANTHTHTHTHRYIHAYVCTFIHTYINTCLHIHTHTCMHMYIHAYIHTCIHTCTYMCTHKKTNVHTYIWVHTYIHMYIHTHVHTTYIHTLYTIYYILYCMYLCVWVCVCLLIRGGGLNKKCPRLIPNHFLTNYIIVCMYVVCTCVYVCMYVCMYLCMYVCMYVCMWHIYMYVCMYVFMYVCMWHIYIHMPHTYMHTYIHTYMHTYIHTYTHVHTYTCTYHIHIYIYIWVDLEL